MRRSLAIAAAAFGLVSGQDTTGSGAFPCQGPCVVPYGPPISNTTVQGQMGYLASTNMLGLASSSAAGMMASYPFSGWLLANDTIIGQRFGTPATQIYHVGFVCGSAVQLTASSTTASCPRIDYVYSSPEFCRVNWKTDARCPEATASATALPPADSGSPKPAEASATGSVTAFPTRQAPVASVSPTGSPKSDNSINTQASATGSVTAFPTRQAPADSVSPTGSPKPAFTDSTNTQASANATAYPTRQAPPSPTSTSTIKEAAAPTWQAPTMEYSAAPSRPPTDNSDEPTHHPCPDICVRRNVTGVPLSSNYTAPIMDHSDTAAPTSLLKVMPGRYAMAGQQGYSYVGWVIIDGQYAGQKFIGADGEVLFVGFVCMPDAPGPAAFNATDECGNRLMLMSPEFCGIDWSAGDVCRPEPTKPAEPSADTRASMTAKPTEEPADITLPTMTAMPTPHPSPPGESAPPTPRPSPPGESAPFTPRPTPRPTYSALPTRRPTLSSRPTLQFRTPRPEVVTRPIAAIASSISIQVRNETLFDNPKNVEAVVKTIVCSLRVDYASVSVESIAHYRDGVFIRNITVPPKEPSRNMTGVCGFEMTPANSSAVAEPSQVPAVSLAPVVSSVSFEGGFGRRLQAAGAGLDTYTLNYAIADPPATVTTLEPATVATLIETSPVLATSLDMPANSYIAVSASEPALITAPAGDLILASPASPANNTTNILLGTLVPFGVLLVASIVATVVRRRGRGSPYAKGEPVISSMSPVLVVGASTPAIDQANPMGPQKQPSRRLVAPVKVRRIGS